MEISQVETEAFYVHNKIQLFAWNGTIDLHRIGYLYNDRIMWRWICSNKIILWIIALDEILFGLPFLLSIISNCTFYYVK